MDEFAEALQKLMFGRCNSSVHPGNDHQLTRGVQYWPESTMGVAYHVSVENSHVQYSVASAFWGLSKISLHTSPKTI